MWSFAIDSSIDTLAQFPPVPRTNSRTRPTRGRAPNVKTSFVVGGAGCRNFPGLYIYPRQALQG
jgi:hypothetical protein